MSDLTEQVEAFKRLSQKRKTGLLEPSEEEEYRRLGRLLAALQRTNKGVTLGLRAPPLPGCDFFDDFPSLYRQGVITNGQDLPPAEGEAVLPGAVSCRGQVVLDDGNKMAGQVLWAPEPSVDGRAFERRSAQAVMLRDDGGVVPGSGRLLLTADGRQITGFLASDVDPEFVDLIPQQGAPRGVARLIVRRDCLKKIEPWHPA